MPNLKEKQHYRTIAISDCHLGTKHCKANLLDDFLKNHSCDTLLLVGDIIDTWRIKQNKWDWKQSHTNVVQRVLGYAKHGTNVIYVVGNHDEFLRLLLSHDLKFGKVTVVDQAEIIGIDGLRYLVVHGDMFDGISKIAPWLAFLGDRAYDVALNVNGAINYVRSKFGFGYYSISKVLKSKVKTAVGFVFDFEKSVVTYCKKHNYDGVICGHIHTPEIKEVQGVKYMNDGDWVESCTALVEHLDGKWELIHWVNKKTKVKNEININNY